MPDTAGERERGFTIIESVIAFALILGVCLALLSSLATGVRGVVTARQRTGAIAIANQLLEQAKARSYDEVGHWTSDSTLTSDANVSGTSPNYTYDGEPLVASSIAGTNPPFSPHVATNTVDGVTFTRAVYVTQVNPPLADPHKRVIAKVSWSASQYGSSAIPNSVSLTTFVYNASPPPDPLLQGVVDADSGRLTLTGLVAGVNLDQLVVWLPFAHGEVNSNFVRRTNGFANTARTQLTLTAGSATGCTTSDGGLTADCPGAKSETVADNDGGTAPPEDDALGPIFDFGGSVSAGSALSATFGNGGATSQSTARSCFSCYGPDIGDNDGYAYDGATATGAAGLGVPFSVGNANGSLLAAAAGCTSSCAAATVDVDRVATNPRIISTASTTTPALDLLTLSGAPAGFDGMVRIAGSTATTTAHAGPGAPSPSVSGPSFTVKLYETTGSPGYRTVTINPGTAATPAPAHAELSFGIDTVIMDATVVARPASSATTSGGGAVSHAEAALTNWLTITVRLQVSRLGSPLADLNLELDYGRIAATADYAPAP